MSEISDITSTQESSPSAENSINPIVDGTIAAQLNSILNQALSDVAEAEEIANTSLNRFRKTLICNGAYIKCIGMDSVALKRELYRRFGIENITDKVFVDAHGISVFTPNSLYMMNTRASGFDLDDLTRGYCIWDDIIGLDGFNINDARVVIDQDRDIIEKVMEVAKQQGADVSDFGWKIIEYKWGAGPDAMDEFHMMLPIKYNIKPVNLAKLLKN